MLLQHPVWQHLRSCMVQYTVVGCVRSLQVRPVAEDEMFKVLKSGKRMKKSWKRMITKVSNGQWILSGTAGLCCQGGVVAAGRTAHARSIRRHVCAQEGRPCFFA